MYSKKIKSLILFLTVIIVIIAASLYSLILLDTISSSPHSNLITKIIKFAIIFSVGSTIILASGKSLTYLTKQSTQHTDNSNDIENQND